MYEDALADDARLDAVQRELLALTWKLLDAINTGDSETYGAICAPDLSCFEDVCNYRIDGLEFHLDLVKQIAQNPELKPKRFDILSPRIQVYGDTGIVTYTRLMTFDDAGFPRWTTCNETRVYVRFDGAWKLVHFHRTTT